jgi:hypothetical protein
VIDEAGRLVPDVASIGIVAELLEDGGYRVQMPGRYQSIMVRSLTGGHRVGDPVIVLLEPHETIPVVLGPSPWRVVADVAPANLYWPGISPHDVALDIVDAVAATALVQDVARNYASRHARGHALCSSADHVDVIGTPSDQDVLIYDGTTWRPGPPPAPTPSTSRMYARRLMMMGM